MQVASILPQNQLVVQHVVLEAGMTSAQGIASMHKACKLQAFPNDHLLQIQLVVLDSDREASSAMCAYL